MPSQSNSPQPANPHDAVFRRILGRPANAASQLRAILPPELVARLDLDRMELSPGSFVDSALRWRHSDLLYTVPLDEQDAFVYVLEEHQSSEDPLMAFRMLRYMVLIWDQYIREHPQTKRLPVVVPIVIHQGRRRWTSSTELLDLFGPIGKIEAVAEYLPRLRFLLEDLPDFDARTLRERPMAPQVRLLYLLLQIAAGNPHIDDDLRAWIDDLRAVFREHDGAQDFGSLMAYIWAVGDTPTARLDALSTELGPEAREAYMTTADELRQEGERKGEARGRTEGRTEALVQFMTIKFGPLTQSVLDTVNAATIDRIELWTSRVVTAETLDAVLR